MRPLPALPTARPQASFATSASSAIDSLRSLPEHAPPATRQCCRSTTWRWRSWCASESPAASLGSARGCRRPASSSASRPRPCCAARCTCRCSPAAGISEDRISSGLQWSFASFGLGRRRPVFVAHGTMNRWARYLRVCDSTDDEPTWGDCPATDGGGAGQNATAAFEIHFALSILRMAMKTDY
jgi:hypothetical protein